MPYIHFKGVKPVGYQMAKPRMKCGRGGNPRLVISDVLAVIAMQDCMTPNERPLVPKLSLANCWDTREEDTVS